MCHTIHSKLTTFYCGILRRVACFKVKHDIIKVNKFLQLSSIKRIETFQETLLLLCQRGRRFNTREKQVKIKFSQYSDLLLPPFAVRMSTTL